MRTLNRFVTATAAVVTYVALLLTIAAGTDLREAAAFHDAPDQASLFRHALDRGDAAQAQAISRWFDEHAPSSSRSRTSVSLAADAVEDGEFDFARRYSNDLDSKVAEDLEKLDDESAQSWGRAWPWLVIGAILTAAALVLRHRRHRQNAEVVDVVIRFVPPQPRWRRPVFLVVSGIGYTLMVGGFLAVVTATRADELPWAARGIVLAAGVAALPVAYFVLKYSRPRSARGAKQTLQADWRKPVLYLRGFGDDPEAAVVDELPGALAAGLLSIHSREEHLIGALNAFGPVVAVGEPGEQLPYLGAARFYLPGDDWQKGVLELMELSQLIVLRLGDGDGVWWEVEQARRTQPPGKLVVLVPGERPDLAARLDARVEVAAEPGRWTSNVVVFEEDWAPRVQPVGPFPGDKNKYGAAVFYVARAMQAALGVKRAMGLRINSHMLSVYGKVLLLVPAFVLIVLFLRLIFLW
ncbi:hypothetical protein [Lentzea sp. NPDC051838]|uniref:hypothetical protein n=1 Tax=Lentzea sp. NPDC051838 TaxID=3154849 RepID=UPI00343F9907